ncbi:MAG: alpha/beta fold hydrolase [Candidatus Magasanikbacteria bacterium]|nr:alpha/beta fold hydrolase [Candidatus Magasanikbacteria bacterium]
MMTNSNKPVFFWEGGYSINDIENFKVDNKIWKICDLYKDQLEELFEINNPDLEKDENYTRKINEFIEQKGQGNWVYFPWNGVFLHILNKEDYFKLRTNRNKNLIKESEQNKLYESTIGVVGLSVGSHVITNLVYSGIGGKMKLADFDKMDTTNLNRLRAAVSDVGEEKTNIIARQIYELDPYANLSLYKEGLNKANLASFFNEDRPDIIFEAIDDFEMKILLRLEARKKGVPVVMLTNLGDRLLIDIERYDKNKDLEFFNGLLGNIEEEILGKNLSREEKNRLAVKLVGRENVPHRALESVAEIGRSLVGRPQLASTVSVSGGMGAYIARKLILDGDLQGGRRIVKFNDLLMFDKKNNNFSENKTAEQRLADSIGVDIEIKQMKVNGYDINYIEAGEGEPLLLIHGGNIGWGFWHENIEKLAKKFKIVALDMPGGGRSSKMNLYDLRLEEDLVLTVENFIMNKFNGPISIMGASIGGWVTLKLALRGEVLLNKIILVDALGFTDYMAFRDRIISLKPLAKIVSRTFLKPTRENKRVEKFLKDVFYNKNINIRKEFIDYFYETMITSHNLIFISRLSNLWGVRREFILKDHLGNIKNDTLIIWGQEDKLMPIEKNAQNFGLLQNSRVFYMRRTGHIPSIESPESFNNKVLEFFKG